MISFKVELVHFTNTRTFTYVLANTREQAKRLAERRVNAKSPGGWRALGVTAEYPPDGFRDVWA